jgi:hypothetical protein
MRQLLLRKFPAAVLGARKGWKIIADDGHSKGNKPSNSFTNTEAPLLSLGVFILTILGCHLFLQPNSSISVITGSLSLFFPVVLARGLSGTSSVGLLGIREKHCLCPASYANPCQI